MFAFFRSEARLAGRYQLYCSAEQMEHLEQFGAGVLEWVYTLDGYFVLSYGYLTAI